MKCPKCDAEISNEETTCKYCNNVIKKDKEKERTYADCLNFFSNLNLIITIVSSIAIWINFSTIEYKSGYSEINWYGIVGGAVTLIIGLTFVFLLKTIVDIYKKVKE